MGSNLHDLECHSRGSEGNGIFFQLSVSSSPNRSSMLSPQTGYLSRLRWFRGVSIFSGSPCERNQNCHLGWSGLLLYSVPNSSSHGAGIVMSIGQSAGVIPLRLSVVRTLMTRHPAMC